MRTLSTFFGLDLITQKSDKAQTEVRKAPGCHDALVVLVVYNFAGVSVRRSSKL